MFWNIARGMKRSAFVKLLGRGSGVTSSCLAFEFVVTIFLLKASDSCPFDGLWMYCYQFNSAAYPTWFLPYVTFLVLCPR